MLITYATYLPKIQEGHGKQDYVQHIPLATSFLASSSASCSSLVRFSMRFEPLRESAFCKSSKIYKANKSSNYFV